MLASLKKGRSVNEAEIPPPVATGAPLSQPSLQPPPAVPQHPPPDQQGEPEAAEPIKEEECSSSSSSSAALSTVSSLPSPVAEAVGPTGKIR